jgi:hypothetical protein
MNKPLLIITALAVVVLAAIFLFKPAISGLATLNQEDNSSNIPNVKIATFAVCNQTDNQNICKDKIFASCNGTLIEVNGSEFYCLGKRYGVNNASLGETIQLENWTDDREKSIITGWASS